MNYQHKELAAGRWEQLSFIEQMANISSELERALNWRSRNNTAYCQQSFARTLELIDLTIASLKSFPRLKELTRLREVIADYFSGGGQFVSTEDTLRKYFLCFVYAARKNH